MVVNAKTVWSALKAGTALTPLLALGVAATVFLPAPVLAQGDGTRETIIVTAQKREQSLQDVPIAINVFTDDLLDTLGAEDIAEIAIFTPGLTIDDLDITQPTFTIRGVNTSDFGIGTEPSVGLFIDGIYSARSGAALVFFNDVERVEVLKGPQGTLFGRNTSAGAISIVTKKPNVDAFEFDGTFRYGNFNKRRFEGTVNVPITDTLAVRVNGLFNQRDGYLEDARTGEEGEFENNWAFRAAVGWQPTPATEVIARWEYDEVRKNGPTAVGVNPFSLSQRFDGPYTNDVLDSHETRTLNGASLHVEHDFGFATLTSISGFKSFQTTNREDEDGTDDITRYFDTENIEDNESYYQELRLSGDTGPVTWVGGVSYFKENGFQSSNTTAFTDTIDTVLATTAGFPIFTILDSVGLPVFGIQWDEDIFGDARNQSYAAFGDVTYAVTDRLNLTAGLRYTRDEKEFTWRNGPRRAEELSEITAPGALYNTILGAPLFPEDVPIDVNTFFNAVIGGDIIFDFGALEGDPFTREETFDDISPRFVVDYKVTDDALLFFSASRGYKAGGFNTQEPNSFFDDESVWNFEGGVKSEWFDGDLRVNASAYYFKYKDRQQISLEGISTSGIPQFTTLTGDSQAWGIDLDSQWFVTDALALTLTAGFIDSEWDTRTERGLDISGQPTGEPYARIVVGFDYEYPLGERYGTLNLHVDNSYTTARRLNDADDLAIALFDGLVRQSVIDDRDDARNITNARLTWTAPSEHYAVSAWVENLFEDQGPRDINDITTETLGTPYVRVEEPRFYGVDVRVTF